jgi:quercetin dioxygenase-like cupin family protein
MNEPFVVRADEARVPVYNIFGDLVSIKVTGSDTGGKYTVMEGVTPPQGGPPLHSHTSDFETFMVLEGKFLFVLNDQEVILEAGDTVHIPPGVVHQYQNIGDAPGRVFLVVEPAGLDEFFGDLDAVLKASPEPDMPSIAALHGKYRMELLGPPLAARG